MNYEFRHYGDLFPYETLDELIKEHGITISPEEKQQQQMESGASFYDMCNNSCNNFGQPYGKCCGSAAICDVCNNTSYDLLCIEALEELQGMNICSQECMKIELESRMNNNGLEALRQCKNGEW